MKRLVDTKNLNKTEWLMHRKKGLTGTDAAAILGLNPYKSAIEVWRDKTTDEISVYDNEAMRQGRDLEEYVASRFEEESGLKVRKANAIYQSTEHPILLADFDRMIVGQNAGLECKTVSPYSSEKWADGSIPPQYYMQVQHYLSVSNYDSWFISALIFGRELIVRKIERDQELIDSLIMLEERFWNENVLRGIMPDPDGSKSCSELISKMYDKATRDKAIELIGVKESLQRRDEILALEDKLERERKQIEQQIQLQMEDAQYASAEGYKVSWTNVESTRLDTKRLKAERPDLYSEYSNQSTSRRFSIKAA